MPLPSDDWLPPLFGKIRCVFDPERLRQQGFRPKDGQRYHIFVDRQRAENGVKGLKVNAAFGVMKGQKTAGDFQYLAAGKMAPTVLERG